MKLIWNIGMQGQRSLYSILLVLALAAGVVTAVQPVLTGRILQILSDNEWNAARTFMVLLVLVFVLDLVLHVLISWLQAYIGSRCGARLRDHTMQLAVKSQQGAEGVLPTGEVQNRVLTDSATAPYSIVNAIPAVLRAFTLLVACVVGMAFISLTLFGAVISIIALTVLIVWLITRWIKNATYITRADAASYGTSVWNLLDSLKIHKSRNAESWALQRVAVKSDKLRKSCINTDVSTGLVMPTLNLGTQIALVLSIGGVIWGMATGRLSTGDGATFVMFMLYSLSPVVELGTLVSGITQASVAESRLREIWNQPQELQGDSLVPQAAHPALVCKNVSYTYPGAEEPVLHSIDLRIEGPGLFLLRGSNGVGKSTLLSLANGVFPAGGKILVNGADSATLSRQSWRENVLVVDQHREPCEGTLRDNLGSGLDISDAERVHAMARTGFDKHYQDLDLHLGAGGIELSGGQRSLLALTDALIRKPQILLLDEIAAGVDKETMPTVVAVIAECAQHSTVVAVTHDSALDALPHHPIEMADLKAA